MIPVAEEALSARSWYPARVLYSAALFLPIYGLMLAFTALGMNFGAAVSAGLALLAVLVAAGGRLRPQVLVFLVLASALEWVVVFIISHSPRPSAIAVYGPLAVCIAFVAISLMGGGLSRIQVAGVVASGLFVGLWPWTFALPFAAAVGADAGGAPGIGVTAFLAVASAFFAATGWVDGLAQ